MKLFSCFIGLFAILIGTILFSVSPSGPLSHIADAIAVATPYVSMPLLLLVLAIASLVAVAIATGTVAKAKTMSFQGLRLARTI